MTTQQQKTTPLTKNADEMILVVPRKNLFPNQAFTGFQAVDDFAFYQKIINNHQEFLPRGLVETDPSYKQIIPYLIFAYNNTYFLMRRKTTASESRLKDKYSLGIGGHLRQEDLVGNDLFEWAQREFFEEINYQETVKAQPLGIINDERDAVGQVHTGFVFILRGSTNQISIKDEHKEGKLITLEEALPLYYLMESWSQLVYDYLKAQK